MPAPGLPTFPVHKGVMVCAEQAAVVHFRLVRSWNGLPLGCLLGALGAGGQPGDSGGVGGPQHGRAICSLVRGICVLSRRYGNNDDSVT